MRILGNAIWILFGGLFIALEYFLSSIILFISIIGIPFGIQTLKLALLSLWPFGAKIKNTQGQTGCLYTFMNILWIFTGGFCICISHLIFGLLFAVTIIGLPFAKQHFKLASIALTPFGKEIEHNL